MYVHSSDCITIIRLVMWNCIITSLKLHRLIYTIRRRHNTNCTRICAHKKVFLFFLIWINTLVVLIKYKYLRIYKLEIQKIANPLCYIEVKKFDGSDPFWIDLFYFLAAALLSLLEVWMYFLKHPERLLFCVKFNQ